MSKPRVIVPVYSEQDLTPKAMSVIRDIVDASFPEHEIKFTEWFPGYSSTKRVLVFGKLTAPGSFATTKFVYTYSIAQLMTKANAVTVLTAALQQFVGTVAPPPFEAPQRVNFTDLTRGWDTSVPIVVDIETDGNLGVMHTPDEVNVISIAVYQAGKTPRVTAYSRDDGSGVNILTDTTCSYIASCLALFDTLIFHNGKFDLRVLNRVSGVELKNGFDTMLAHHVLNQAAGQHDLKGLARLYFGATDWEAGIRQFTQGGGHYENIPMDKIVEYNGWDVYWTHKLYELLAPMIEADEDAQKAFMLEMAAAEFLMDVERHGIPFDMQYSYDLASSLAVDIELHKNRLREYAGDENFNPNSPNQVKVVLDTQFGEVVESTNKDTIEELNRNARNGSDLKKFCSELLMFRRAAKARSTYAEGWRKFARNGRVHPTFLVHGTSTGRLSSSSPNAQNVPRDKVIRQMVGITDGAE